MVKELENEDQKINAVYSDTLRNNQIQNLIRALTNIDNKSNNIKNAYLQIGNTMTYDAMVFNKSTISQLKSGGNMRLIKNRAVVDSIHSIDTATEQLEKQLTGYEALLSNNSVYMGKIFDYRYFIKFKDGKSKMSFSDYINQQANTQYLNNDEKLRVEFAMSLAYQNLSSIIISLCYRNIKNSASEWCRL